MNSAELRWRLPGGDESLVKAHENRVCFSENGAENDQEQLKALETLEGLEAYARENYKMKRENEDIYIIASDTTNQSK